jgi:hypothetical protein
LGYDVDDKPLRAHHDIILNGCTKTDAKGANLTRVHGDGPRGYKFELIHDDGSKMDHDLLILEARRLHVVGPRYVYFIIPGLVVPEDQCSITISTLDPLTYRGKWSPFREAWDFVELVTTWRAATRSNDI